MGCPYMKNTLRFRWKEDVPVMERGRFTEEVLIGMLECKVEDIFCLQDNPRDRGFDVTVGTEEVFVKMYRLCVKWRGKRLLKDVDVLGFRNHKLVTVHMYDPHVADGDIAEFLGSFGGLLYRDVLRVKDKMGIWTGSRVFSMMLKLDPGGFDGLKHPPAYFTVGKVRGCLHCNGRPPSCGRCGGEGHGAGGCAAGSVPGACHACGSLEHLVKDCPGRGGAGGGTAGVGVVARPSAAPAKASPATAAAAKATPAEKTGAVGTGKGEVRAGSQAFDGAGTTPPRTEVKKLRTTGEREEVMDTGDGEVARAGGGQAGTVLGFDSGRPSCLFSPPSPARTVETLPDRAEKDKGGKPPD